MRVTHLDAEHRYQRLREMALKSAENAVSKENIKFKTITHKALEATRQWPSSSSRRVDWDWIEGYSSFKFRHPKRFELALWDSNTLMALSLGRPTYQGSFLRLDFVEASPRELGERPPAFGQVLVAYNVYARVINASHVRIMHPVNSDVRAYYETFGYTYIDKEDCLVRRV